MSPVAACNPVPMNGLTLSRARSSARRASASERPERQNAAAATQNERAEKPTDRILWLPGSQVDCLPAGPASSYDALALIASGRLSVVVKELSSDYDCIILAAPPAVGSSCTLLAAALADAALLIARSGQSTYAEVVRGLDLLASSLGASVSRAGANSLALVLTDAPARSLPAPYRDKTPIGPALQSLHLSRAISMGGRPVGDTLLRSKVSGDCALAKLGDAS